MTDIERVGTDVVVLGGGGSGLAAALEARSAGAAVVLIEKNPALGGTTRLSVGSISACRTPHQARKGIADSPEAFVEDIALFTQARGVGGRENVELTRLLAERSGNTLEWLMSLGLEFFGPMPEPPNRVPRMHNVLPNSSAYIYHLSRHARRRGVTIMLGARAERLSSQAGRVTGVQVKSADGRRLEVVARRGVVLATGDYSSSRELKKAYISPAAADVEGINPTSTGDGHTMAVELGGHVLNGDLASGPEIRFVAPPRRLLVAMIPPARPIARIMSLVANRLRDSWLRPMITSFITSYLGPSPKLYQEGAVLINRDGNRFVDELSSPAAAIAAQPGNAAYIVFDARVAERFTAWPYYISTASGVAYAFLKDYRRNRRDIYKEAPTLEGLAQAIGVPVPALTRTIAEYNGLVDGNKSDALGRVRLGQGLRVPPFYALGPAKAWIAITDGGLAVSSRMEVLTATGKTISGLYAAGSAGQGGAILEAHGLRLCWAFTSGRIAGRSAAGG